MDELLKDSRFAHVAKDPKFRRIPKAERKIKIDRRFQGMFKDKKFAIKYTVDKRGRPVNQTSAENLRKYYDLSSGDEEPDEEPAAPRKIKKKIKSKTKTQDKLKIKEEEDEAEVSEEEESNIEHQVEDDSSDNYVSSNGELLRIKPKEESDAECETTSDSDSDEDNDCQNSEIKDENQLLIRRKYEKVKLSEKVKDKLRDLTVNYARGEGVLLTDSSSEEDSSEISDQEEEIEHDWGELDKEAETTDEITHRLAVCNMDWDRIRALDLMVLFNSFLPSDGLVRSVKIYPSEFGLKRMKEEETNGPPELREESFDPDVSDDNEEGSEYHMEKLRKYQLNRLKYYYAVIEFDSAETANKIYTECDGIEYESTATKIDLRFIPNDMEFDQEPKEICDELPKLSKYQPRQFTTTALQQVKVELTWDETNPERQEIAQKLNSGKLDEIKDSDLQAYLASDTSENESDKEEKEQADNNSEVDTNTDPVEKYKSLLQEIEEKEEAKRNKEVELEFTWGLGEKEKAEKLVQKRLKEDQQLTPFEQYLEKRKAKRKAKKEEKKKLQNESAGLNSRDSDLSDTDENDDVDRNINGRTSVKAKSAKQNSTIASNDDNEERRKAELELLLMDENADENKRHFNIKKIEENATMSKSKQKRLNKKKNGGDVLKEDDFEVDVKDPRFNALFTSHHFNIDPADPHYRKTKGTEALIHEKLKRRMDDDHDESVKEKKSKVDKKLNTELQALVKSVKNKSQNTSRPIKRS